MIKEILETGFIVTIVAITIYFHIKFDRFAVAHGPEVLTTLGILGCFTGITIALFNFNPDNISQSVPNLLAGIRTAFWASLAGVAGALTLRIGQRFRKIKDSNDQIATQTSSLSDVVLSINTLKLAIIGNDKSNLLKEIKAIKVSSEENFNAIRNDLDVFSKHMVENNQKAVIEALRKVIKDFNIKISEQFGDNFKDLNVSVSKLLVWQTEYKNELNIIKDQQKATREDLQKSADYLSQIVKSSGDFKASASALTEQIDFLNKKRNSLADQQKSLANVLKSMEEVTPKFEVKTTDMLKQIENGIGMIHRQFAENSNRMVNQLSESERHSMDLLKKMFNNSESHVKDLQLQLQKITENLNTHLLDSGNQFTKLLTKAITDNQNSLRSNLEENSQIVKESVFALDKALEKELNHSLEALGRQLAALSEKFVDDYLPLTEKLKQVVELSKKL